MNINSVSPLSPQSIAAAGRDVTNAASFLSNLQQTQQADPALAPVPVIVLSALDHGRAADVEADAFLKKPLDFDRLLSLVRTYCH